MNKPEATTSAGWVDQLFASIDSKDAAAFSEFLTEDAHFTFGNQPRVSGKAAIQDAVGVFFNSIAALTHRIDHVWELDDAVICHGDVSYQRLDGSSVALPFADIFYLRGGLISDYRIYMDVTPLFAAAV